MAPRTPVEETLAGIWEEILGHPPRSIHENFFELGGHSLQAMRALAHLHEVLQVTLPLRHFFENPAIAWSRCGSDPVAGGAARV